ncbi:putative polyprenyl synthase [Leptomonas pyrrhocoris]|uniref:Putative polyprenyl synthase n=1 Tax=Leptomonas pyrrhocoris TaxID=157538 RepID=A0A0N0VG37_LEPPY|nr:putative polyprenyl synthase [Leptomonas pyrrhocoris]KPA82634.1 putative polyprenyl synthase [Leptomonas pyrrhocoris]|eukprot:XP_015661073.1 putative polyprenyl synthase [Leptomonas pyrrhocoris]
MPYDFWPSCFPPRGVHPDPAVYDQCNDASALQWWYGNAHLNVKGEDGPSFGFFGSFFRRCEDECATSTSVFHDACAWALVDLRNEKYYADSVLDPDAIAQIRKGLDPEVTGRPTEHVQGALLELVKKGRLPRPDHMMETAAVYTAEPFGITMANHCELRTEQDGLTRRYTFTMHNSVDEVSVHVSLEAEGAPVLQGKDGRVNGMYYYYYPSMRASGYVEVDGVRHEVCGTGWYDREFDGAATKASQDAQFGWSWLSLQASSGAQVSVCHVTEGAEQATRDVTTVLTRADRTRVLCEDGQLEVTETWTSMVTFTSYPVACRVRVESIGLDVAVRAAFAAQEFCTVVVSGAGFYEGVMEGTGAVDGASVTVRGFLEHKRNALPYASTSGLLRCVGAYVHDMLAKACPLTASDEWVAENILGRHCIGRGVPADRLCRVLFEPARLIIDRGGKSWRSLILVSCCNALSRQHFDCSRYIAVAELLHVGSLIIDDVQDDSVLRRGGECAHLVYGVSSAINVGCACYFLSVHAAGIQDLPDAKAAKIYKLYFDVMIAGHAGQGLDISGLHYLVPAAVKSGNAEPLFDALDAVHTYKSGGVAGTLCLMACVLCDAPPDVSAALESFGVALGLAFQIVDDALNVSGFEGDLKEKAEDIKAGKVTYPIAVAMGRLGAADREALWSILSSEAREDADVRRAVSLLNEVGAVDECLMIAQRRIRDTWEKLDPLLEDSFPKLMLRTFCTYLVEHRL